MIDPGGPVDVRPTDSDSDLVPDVPPLPDLPPAGDPMRRAVEGWVPVRLPASTLQARLDDAAAIRGADVADSRGRLRRIFLDSKEAMVGDLDSAFVRTQAFATSCMGSLGDLTRDEILHAVQEFFAGELERLRT